MTIVNIYIFLIKYHRNRMVNRYFQIGFHMGANTLFSRGVWDYRHLLARTKSEISPSMILRQYEHIASLSQVTLNLASFEFLWTRTITVLITKSWFFVYVARADCCFMVNHFYMHSISIKRMIVMNGFRWIIVGRKQRSHYK